MGQLSVWFDEEGDFLEVTLDHRKGHFDNLGDGAFERVDEDGNTLGFAILNVDDRRARDPLRRRVQASLLVGDSVERLVDFVGRELRLTDERLDHIERRPEMDGRVSRIEETLADPDEVRSSDWDDDVHRYYRGYLQTPVTESSCWPASATIRSSSRRSSPTG